MGIVLQHLKLEYNYTKFVFHPLDPPPRLELGPETTLPELAGSEDVLKNVTPDSKSVN